MKLLNITIVATLGLMSFGLLDGFVSYELAAYLTAGLFVCALVGIYLRRKPPTSS